MTGLYTNGMMSHVGMTQTVIAITFAVWINLGTNQVFFNYVDMPATLGTGSVGFENTTGEIGLSAYYNGSGFSPVSNSSHEAILAQGETGLHSVRL